MYTHVFSLEDKVVDILMDLYWKWSSENIRPLSQNAVLFLHRACRKLLVDGQKNTREHSSEIYYIAGNAKLNKR